MSEVEVDLRDVESRHSDEKLERIIRLVTESESQKQEDWNPHPTVTQRTMCIPKLGLYRLSPDAILPTRGSKYSACWDVYAVEDVNFGGIDPNFKAMKTGWRLVIPEGWRIDVRARSGLAAKQGITVLNAPGMIDHDYEDELMIIIYATGGGSIKKGSRIAQIALERVQEFTVAEVSQEDLPVIDSDRVGGLGSTGV